jgi:hypothetical protein
MFPAEHLSFVISETRTALGVIKQNCPANHLAGQFIYQIRAEVSELVDHRINVHSGTYGGESDGVSFPDVLTVYLLFQ